MVFGGASPSPPTMANYFTKRGLDLLKTRIEKQREKIKLLQKEAAEAAGISYDWHDNFGYEEAKRQEEAETDVLVKLESDLKNAVVIDTEEQSEKVKIGTTVDVIINGKESEFTIGACGETNPAQGLISYISPLANQILDMKTGESKVFILGDTKKEIKIKKIHPPSYKYRKLVAKLIDSR